MANHKRGRPKNRRAGCLLCKPHKANGINEARASAERTLQEKVSDIETTHGLSLYDDDNSCSCYSQGDNFFRCAPCWEILLRRQRFSFYGDLTAKFGELVYKKYWVTKLAGR